MLHRERRKKDKAVFELSEESRPRLTDAPLPLQDSAFPKDQLEFDVAFLEGVLAGDPYNEEALLFLGNAYTQLGRYEDGLRMDERIVRMFPTDLTCLYNLACSYSLLQRVDEALDGLRRAIENGYSDLVHMLQDEDLANVREDARFGEIVQSMQPE